MKRWTAVLLGAATLLIMLVSASDAGLISMSGARGSPPSGGGGGGDPTADLLSTDNNGYANWSIAGLNAVPFTASIATNGTMTVTQSFSKALGPGQVITGTGVTVGTAITALGTGTGGTGTYTVSPSPGGAISSQAMTAAGIPNRATIYTTLSPSGGDDTSAIQTALNACPAGQVVKLNTGVFRIQDPGLTMSIAGCTLRGSGPGQQLNTGLNQVGGGGTVRSCTSGTLVTRGDGSYCTDSTATQLVNYDRATSPGHDMLRIFPSGAYWGSSYALVASAVQGAYSLTLTSAPSPAVNAGDIVVVTQNGQNDPELYYGDNIADTPGSQYWDACPDSTASGAGTGQGGPYRNLCQMMEVVSTSNGGKTITFNTPFTYPYHISAGGCTGCAASLTVYSGDQPLHGVGVENLFIWGAVNDGNIGITNCAYCWVKNVESAWSRGASVSMTRAFHSVLRDSFLHETPDPNPGGAGYQLTINTGASENLVENNIIWYGNKVVIMQASGGGNVFAYNYTDDAFGAGYPDLPEAGINAGHRLAGHLELLEGNYSHKFNGDAYWGAAPHITAFRNHISQHRAARAPLNSYMSGTCSYGDYAGDSRSAVDLQGGSYDNAFVGNVLGTSGQTLTGSTACNSAQGGFLEQTLTAAQAASADAANRVSTWRVGYVQSERARTWIDTTINTQTRTANWAWCCSNPSNTGSYRCYDLHGGKGGTSNQSCSSVTVPSSFYLAAKPAFFGTQTWPWVDPTTGTVYTLPAKYCFEHGAMPTCSIP